MVVAGDGVRQVSKPEREFLIGLRRALPPEQFDALRVRAATHHALMDEPRPTEPWPNLNGVAAQLGQNYERCTCCPNGPGYEFFAKASRSLGYSDWAWRRGSVEAWSFRDVRAYLTSPVLRKVVADCVSEQIETTRPEVVIAHSLGSAIAIEGISQAASKHAPALVVTAGAPFVWPRFAAIWSPTARAWMKGPKATWLNVVDLSDSVTGSSVPATEMYGGSTHIVVNNDHLVNRKPLWTAVKEGDMGPSSTHLVRHYLAHPPIARAFAGLFSDEVVT